MDGAVTQQGADLILTQVVLSGLAAKALAFIKQSKNIPWISAETQRLNRVVAAVLAAATAVGVHVQFDHTAGVLTVTGLTAASILHLGWEWGKSYLVQEFIGNMAYRTRAPQPPAQPGQ